MQMRKVMTSKKKIHLNNKILNQEYLQKYWSGVLQTWQQKCTSEKKQNDTHFAVIMRTLLAPVSFCEKPIQIPQSEDMLLPQLTTFFKN